MRFIRLIAMCLLLAASVLNADDATKKFTIAIEDWPPLEYSEGGVMKGINVEVITRIMNRLGVPVEFQFYPFARSCMMAEKGKVDAVSSVSHQPWREDIFFYTEEQKAFSATGKMPKDYLWNAEYALFMKNALKPYFSFKDYNQKGIEDYLFGTVNGYSYDKSFTDADLRNRAFSSSEKAFAALAKGEIDLFPMEVTVGEWMVEKLSLGDKVKRYQSNLFSKPYMLAFTRRSDYPDIEGLFTRFYRELAAMRASGEYESIYESYIRPQYVKNNTRPLIFVCEEWAPLEYLEDGNVTGVDAAVVDYIMKRLGIPYEISIYPWSRAWMMAEKGKADAVLSVSYKASREDVLFYTEDQKQFGKTGKTPVNYLWMSEYVFFVMNNRASSFKFESFSQLKKDGAKVGRNRDYSYCPEFLAAEFDGPIYSKTDDGFLALVSGKIDLYPMDKTIGMAALQRLGLKGSVTYLPKKLFAKPYLSPFCRRSDFPELEKVMSSFYRELRVMRGDGTYDRIYNDAIKRIGVSK